MWETPNEKRAGLTRKLGRSRGSNEQQRSIRALYSAGMSAGTGGRICISDMYITWQRRPRTLSHIWEHALHVKL